MNQVAIRQENKPKLMLLDYMADKYALTPDQFRATVRATCGLSAATPEQVAAFLIVAKEYDLNPLLKEIYAFPGKGGGVVPIVSIDGWVNLVNSHPQCDGFDFAVENDEENKLYAITCTMHRKDRSHPTVVTEYLSECVRNTEPWKMKHRMLRHKSFIQAARYAFGFAGIYDEDEGRVIADSPDAAPKERAAIPSPAEIEGPHGSDKYAPGDVISVVPQSGTEASATIVVSDPISSGPAPKNVEGPDPTADPDSFMAYQSDKMAHIEDGGELETYFNQHIETRRADLFPSDFQEMVEKFERQQAKIKADE